MKWTFLALIVAQTAHSIEEYATHLYNVLAPARFVSSLVSTDLALGFAIANAALISFGVACFFGPIVHGARYAAAIAWGWAVLELMNGGMHIGWASIAHAYRPGVATAPLLFAIAATLAWQLARTRSRETPRAIA